MAEKIGSLHELMSSLARIDAEFAVAAEAAVAACTVKVQADAKSKFGHYQDAVGEFPEWEELAPATIRAKERAGATADDPLIGHYKFSKRGHFKRPGGQLRDSILAEVRGLVGEVGTNDELAPYHEFGTARIPPRPFLRPALLENEKFIRDTFKAAIASAMTK